MIFLEAFLFAALYIAVFSHENAPTQIRDLTVIDCSLMNPSTEHTSAAGKRKVVPAFSAFKAKNRSYSRKLKIQRNK